MHHDASQRVHEANELGAEADALECVGVPSLLQLVGVVTASGVASVVAVFLPRIDPRELQPLSLRRWRLALVM